MAKLPRSVTSSSASLAPPPVGANSMTAFSTAMCRLPAGHSPARYPVSEEPYSLTTGQPNARCRRAGGAGGGDAPAPPTPPRTARGARGAPFPGGPAGALRVERGGVVPDHRVGQARPRRQVLGSALIAG